MLHVTCTVDSKRLTRIEGLTAFYTSSDFRPERRITFLDAITKVQSRLGHQRSSRCARAGHVSGYYRVAKQLAGHQRGSRCARAGHVSGYYGVAMQLNELYIYPGMENR